MACKGVDVEWKVLEESDFAIPVSTTLRSATCRVYWSRWLYLQTEQKAWSTSTLNRIIVCQTPIVSDRRQNGNFFRSW